MKRYYCRRCLKMQALSGMCDVCKNEQLEPITIKSYYQKKEWGK
ncbi:hypothetical protein [Bacillus coahuilensis]|nr:hypothetical protein [Bacillus coahuilensis]